MMFSRKQVNTTLMNKLQHRMAAQAAKISPKTKERSVADIMARLDDIKKFM